MKLSTHGSKLALACALLIASGCDRHLIIDEGGGEAGASAGEAGQAGTTAGEDGHAGTTAGEGSAGQAGEAGQAGTGEAGAAGEGGSAGDGSAGSAGEAGAAGGDGVGGQFGDQPPVTTHWSGNDASCPAEPVYSGACPVEGLVCGYYTQEGNSDTGYSECACHMSCTESGTEMQWECHGNGGGRLDLCPEEQPEEGSSCFGLKGVKCYYPVYVECGCPRDAEDSTWHCEYLREPPPAHPTVVDEDTVVSEMTDEERATWCAWYSPAESVEPGFPQPPEREPTEDGFYPDTGCTTTSSYGCGTLQPNLPASACEDNLALSTCTATVRDLNDCVLTAGGRNGPSPNGCARYLNTAGCSGTLVIGGASQENPQGLGDECLVRVR